MYTRFWSKINDKLSFSGFFVLVMKLMSSNFNAVGMERIF